MRFIDATAEVVVLVIGDRAIGGGEFDKTVFGVPFEGGVGSRLCRDGVSGGVSVEVVAWGEGAYVSILKLLDF